MAAKTSKQVLITRLYVRRSCLLQADTYREQLQVFSFDVLAQVAVIMPFAVDAYRGERL